MAEPGSRCPIIEFIAHVESVADGTRWLEAPGGGRPTTSAFGLSTYGSRCLTCWGLREAPRFDTP